MKFLVVGLGSMGNRRIRNLQQLKVDEIIAFDINQERRINAERQYGITAFGDFDDAMKINPDALVISTPPDLHVSYALKAAKANKHFFTEASVVDDGMDELINECRKREVVAAPSCTMRFFPEVKTMKEIVDSKVIGNILSFTYHSGQYLPDWHPWEDYRKFYVANRATGGAREIVSFELVWLVWLVGAITEVTCLKGKLSKLEVDIDDTYQVLMKSATGAIGHMLVDVISRVPDRSFKVFGEDGVMFWDWNENVRVYTAGCNKWSIYQKKAGTTVKGYSEKIQEEPYIEEMNAFIDAINRKSPFPYTFEEDKQVLEILYDAEKSSNHNIHVKRSVKTS